MKADFDIRMMREALVEARKGLGLTAPNPPVGAVVVNGGGIVGRGFHRKAGRPHAEPEALADAGERARGADLYVTLEPCSTRGKTPPCTEAILAAGVRRVVIGCEDPNPAHAGRAANLLETAGVGVASGVLEEECRELIRAFARVQRSGRPYLTLKLACSLDGRIADSRGRSKWITGPASRERVRALRREADAILVGTETVRLDDPSLTPRPPEGRAPLRIVPDRRGTLSLDSKVFCDEHAARTLCLLGPDAPGERRRKLEARGARWLEAPVVGERLEWTGTLERLAAGGVQHILCEGGGWLAGALTAAELVDEIHWIAAPKLLGSAARPAVQGDWLLDRAPEFTLRGVDILGDDVWIRLRRG